jgi:predicted kinase
METKVYVLVGMIASGKSTYCKNAAKAGQIILNDDAIVNLVHADNYSAYTSNLKILYKSIENTIVSLALSIGRPVVVDRGLNVSKNARRRFIALANSFDVPCEAIRFEFEGAAVHAKRRYESDSRGQSHEYWLKVAQVHEGLYEPPDITEGFNKIHTLFFNDIISGKVIE